MRKTRVETHGEFRGSAALDMAVAKQEIGRGIVYFSSDEVKQIQGCHSREITAKLGNSDHQEVIHRDHLVIFGES